jgi:ribosomal protein L13E
MPNFRIQIPNAHFHKHWHDQAAHKGRIRTWFNQAARKHRRRENRLAKAQRVFPRPVSGLVRPVVHCQTIRYNSKKRAGKGFTLQELKEAKINRREALGIGISVDYRRKNRSEQVGRKEIQPSQLLGLIRLCDSLCARMWLVCNNTRPISLSSRASVTAASPKLPIRPRTSNPRPSRLPALL